MIIPCRTHVCTLVFYGNPQGELYVPALRVMILLLAGTGLALTFHGGQQNMDMVQISCSRCANPACFTLKDKKSLRKRKDLPYNKNSDL